MLTAAALTLFVLFEFLMSTYGPLDCMIIAGETLPGQA